MAFLSCTSEALTGVKLSDELFYVDDNKIELTAEEVGGLVRVLADCQWTVTVNQTGWADLTVQPMSGTGNGQITLRTGKNTTVNERTATLTVKSANGLCQIIGVRQISGDVSLYVDKSALTFDTDGGSLSFNVTSNIAWEITLPPEGDWLTVSPMSGNAGGPTLVTVTAKEIQDEKDREVTLTIKLNNSSTSHAISVTQVGKEKISLSATPVTLNKFEATGGQQSISIACNAAWKVQKNEADDWFTLSTSAGVGDGVLTISCPPNYTTKENMANIVISSGSQARLEYEINRAAGELPKFPKEDENRKALAVVEGTRTSSGISLTFDYTSMFPLTDHGICYSTTNPMPTAADTRISLGAGTTGATATTTLSGLSPSTTYHARAYLVSPMNDGEVVYSDVLTFTTLGNIPSWNDNPYPQLAPER